MRMENEILTRIFAREGARYGFKDVEARFVAFRDFKVKWRRSYTWISFDVSDYLDDAPEEVMEAIARTVYARIKGDMSVEYGDDVSEWVMSDDFVDRRQNQFVGRFRGLTRSPMGSHRNLEDSYRRLLDMGLVRDEPKLRMGWYNTGGRNSGTSSVLMRVVAINSILDDPEIPEAVLDYCFYAHMCHVEMGFGPDRTGKDAEYQEALARFPMKKEAEDGMRRFSIRI